MQDLIRLMHSLILLMLMGFTAPVSATQEDDEERKMRVDDEQFMRSLRSDGASAKPYSLGGRNCHCALHEWGKIYSFGEVFKLSFQ
jgi:hypothetical protein